MTRIRTLKPEIWLSHQLMNLSHGARLLFIGLITQADDDGRGSADPRRLKASIFPGDDLTASQISAWLAEIASQGLARCYPANGHGQLYCLPTWSAHQKIDRPTPSRYPPFVEGSSNARRDVDEASMRPREGSEGSEGSDLYVPQERNGGGDVERVFEHWQSVHNHPGAKLDPKRKRVILNALKNYSADDLCRAISGYKNSPHHMG